MSEEISRMSFTADVKCYYCGHISGQIVGRRDAPLRVSNFVPRPGYSGSPPQPGVRLRCERCQGPVFLEDAGHLPMAGALERKLVRRAVSRGDKAA